MLFTINETTLVQWYKHTEQINEIKTLLQGLELPPITTCSREPLPDPRQKLTAPPPPPNNPHAFPQPEDTTGRAQVRGVIRGVSVSVFVPPQSASSSIPSTSTHIPSTSSHVASYIPSPSVPSMSSVLPPEPAAETTVETKSALSRTTQWRHMSQQPRERKVYMCQVCKKPMTSPGHTVPGKEVLPGRTSASASGRVAAAEKSRSCSHSTSQRS